MLCGLETEHLLSGQQLMVTQINKTLEGDAAAVKCAKLQIQTERGKELENIYNHNLLNANTLAAQTLLF